ncbi:hypothetical protein BHE74_00008985, partial [Ensete ventricosum]
LQSNMKQVCEERYESALVLMTLPLTKHVDSSKDDVDNACLNDPGLVLVSVDSMGQCQDIQKNCQKRGLSSNHLLDVLVSVPLYN